LRIDEYDDGTLARVRDVCQQLFHGNYITEFVFAPTDSLKKANDSYSFIMSHYDAIEELLDRCGWRLCHDRSAGVLYLDSEYAQAKMVLTKIESCFLLAMRLIYDEKKARASASGEVFVTVREVLEKLTTLGAMDQITKQDREKALRTLSGKNIIARVSGKLSEIDARLTIFPSIICAISSEKTKAVTAMFTSLSAEPPAESEAEEE
jgi:hypothetical protein